MGGAVGYSHEKQKMTAVSLRLIFYFGTTGER